MSEPKQTVLVTGATGYIGRRLASLLSETYTVRCLVRDVARAQTLLPSTVEFIEGDMTDAGSLNAAAAGAHAVVHLAALKSDERDIVAVNVGGAHALVAACKAAGVRRVVNIGTQAGRIAHLGPYGESKAQSDAIFNASGLEVTTLLPSIVYGPDDTGVYGKLTRMVAALPVVPVIGDGRTAYHPIHVDDVCAIIVGCLREAKTIAKTYSVGGLEAITYDGLIDRIGAGQSKKPLKLHIPGWLAMLIARALALVFDPAPLTRSNVLGAIQSAPETDYALIFTELGLRPRGHVL